MRRPHSDSTRSAEEWKSRKAELKALKDKRNVTAEVTAEELARAESEEARAAEFKTEARAALEMATSGLNHAKTWEESAPKRTALERKLTEAAVRSADGARIRTEYAEFRANEEMLPILRQFVPLRASLAESESRLLALGTARDATETARLHLSTELESAQTRREQLQVESSGKGRSAKSARVEIVRRSKLLAVAEEVALLDARWKGYAPSFEQSTADAIAADGVAGETFTKARDTKLTRDNDLRRAAELKAKFDGLAIDVLCSACGNPVTAEHKERELRAAADNHARLVELAVQCDREASEASLAAKAAAVVRAESESQLRDRDHLAVRLESKRRDLENFGGTSDFAELTAQLAVLTAEADADEGAEAIANAELKRLDERLDQLSDEHRAAETASRAAAERCEVFAQAIAADRVRCATLTERLPIERYLATAADLETCETAFQRLATGKITDEFEALQLDEARREEWTAQLADLSAQLDAVPKEARRPLRHAEEACDLAKVTALGADDAWQAAREAAGNLARRKTAFAELCSELSAAERATAVHAKLHDLLGNSGLLRELVRIAEVEIVRFANDSLQKLSDGDLALELSREPKKETEALVLLVRRSESSEPTPVAMLSGGQKFRVALAIALGIGQFASGQKRPLESVIIDEGFGSLDKDGLRAAAEELSRLKQHLKRIILVSHQEEFTDHFPVVIRLEKTDDGVKATTIRR